MADVAYKEGVTGLARTLKGAVPDELLVDPTDEELTAAGKFRPATREQKERAKEQFRRARDPDLVKRQPRDYRGRFRDILARLKVDLGESELNEVVGKVEEAQDAEDRRDYGKSADAATDVVQMVDRLDEGSLNSDQLNNIKNTTRELGKAIAYLPLPQGQQNAKLRFSDLPPSTQQLLNNMKKRVIEKLEPDKAAELLAVLNQFTSGTVQLSSDDLQAELAKLLTYLID